ncbi:bifunctional DNA-formamidopyrimidine glycosylase/DNA-(apurinic or apyrimidinic site) lyase [Pikeienuella piscinae]|uniref:Formamidopyrimidine-DNA glycosylase n=1 Tax=Pikeienuella piscinae TaxID=2748098 RepID=A0A7L5BZE2_9RHOB|nr:bifunctional DNA-formamidopyrimidine glycosylase/DNA-(apurinic or apyrimidinic site) lyase [Pikeienuella piscinae]QIE55887.1 bifunctional DNA-formamidopyrimidine glycosylase/DNA-(apurinic or apyrimidinic site) lyase [Pikeienuella piscinae]
MPELPEVETVRRGLVPAMEGRLIARAIQRRPDLRWPLPERFAERLCGRRVLRLGRRSKYILADLDDSGAGPETMIVHLGMSGRMLVSGATLAEFYIPAGGAARHDHVVFEMEGGATVTFNDARRFGAMDLWPTEAIATHRLLADLGPEPLANEFHGDYLARRFAGRRMPVKAALLDQKIVAGLGNIYVAEALHRARISPKRLAGKISRAGIDRLVAAINATIADALDAGGSSLRDYRQADGELGYFQHSFRVYDREGAVCPTEGCAGRVRRIVQAGRSSFYCPGCQR